jgi:hypothetical protein
MDRPKRQHAHLAEKIGEKKSRSHKKPGKRAKRWTKWLTHYQPLVDGTGPVVAIAKSQG